jgi:demethylmenaquinone methyltransferase/2-methoxy-6-polyprenyl-1,4-benzoquinol methylase
MFARISRRYDLLNTVMTAGRHHAWRRMATDMAVGSMSGPALDIATGTGDFAFELARKRSVSHVVGLDYAREMLAVAMSKAQRKGLSHRLSPVVGDAHAVPFPDDQFICVTVGFGIRNFVDVTQALREIVRVVKPGGRLAILEIVRIEGPALWSKLFPLYFRHVTPWMGALLAGDREAYTYLPQSVQVFLSAAELASVMEEVGLRNVRVRSLALGAVAVHVGEKG